MKLLYCEFNEDTVYIELKVGDGGMISLDTIAVEHEVAEFSTSVQNWAI